MVWRIHCGASNDLDSLGLERNTDHSRVFEKQCDSYFSEVDRSEGVCSIAVDHIEILGRDDVSTITERFKQDVSLVFGNLPEGLESVAKEPPRKKVRTLDQYPCDYTN